MRKLTIASLFLLVTTAAWAQIGSYEFDGTTGEYVEFVDSHTINPTSWTVTFWYYRTTDTGGFERLFSKTAGTYSTNYVQIDDGDDVRVVCHTTRGGNTPVWYEWLTTVPVGEWHHIAAWWDGTELGLHWDGVLVNSTDPAGSCTTAASVDGDDWQIGRLNFSSTWYSGADQRIAYFQVHGSKLTDGEIAQAMYFPDSTAGNSELAATLTDDGTQHDRSGGGFDGTVTGASSHADGPPIAQMGSATAYRPAAPPRPPIIPDIWYNHEGLTFGDGGGVTTWVDSSGNEDTFIPDSTNYLTQRNGGIAGYPVAECDSGEKYRVNDGSPYRHDEALDWFVVMKSQDWNNANWGIWFWGGSGPTGFGSSSVKQIRFKLNGTNEYSATATDDVWYVLRMQAVYNGTNFDYEYWWDGVSVDTTTSSSDPESIFLSGDTISNQDCEDFFYAEIMYYGHALTDDQVVDVYRYLTNKFGNAISITFP